MFAYVGSRTTKERNGRGEGIKIYHVDPDGSWTQIGLVPGLVNPSYLCIDGQGRHLYAVHGDAIEVSSFAIDRSSGKLTFLERQDTGGRNPVHLTIDRSNRFVVIANYATGSVALLQIESDGRLGSVRDLIELPGEPGPHRLEQVSSHPHHAPFDPQGRFIAVPDKGLDRVFTFRLDTASGKLRPAASVPTRECAGPRHIAFHPAKPYAYVANELDSTLTSYRYDPERGTLDPFQVNPATPPDFTATSRAAGIVISPCGSFVCTSNRGHDSIAVHAIDLLTGMLYPVGWQPTGGTTPRFITFEPSGSNIYVTNETSDTIVGFRIDPHTGRLTPTGLVVETGSPVCIVFLVHELASLRTVVGQQHAEEGGAQAAFFNSAKPGNPRNASYDRFTAVALAVGPDGSGADRVALPPTFGKKAARSPMVGRKEQS